MDKSFDPFSGSVNNLLLQMNVLTSPINFFGQRPNALIMVTIFEIWRYFPLSFLFILARMQSIDTEMYEAADMDGASPLQKFWHISLPMLIGIMSILFCFALFGPLINLTIFFFNWWSFRNAHTDSKCL